ncbi:carbohydrate-binding protein [Aquimarina algiphila]|uniref:carbohydrate-binding protein n=1 Tax=Aquimarina algiphila TaxID=2047982 RepID=UPI00232EFDC2|nr:carbohydrate-binding protein [Aquimarina algiphila]
MKHKTFISTMIVLFCVNLSIAQVIESHRQAANALWEAYGRNPSNPSQMPNAVPLNVNSNIDQIVIDPTFGNLETALKTLLDNNGGILRFNNTAPATINFNNVIHLNPSYQNRDKVRTIVIQGKNITFDGQNNTSLFLIRGSVNLVIQDAKLTNANFKGVSQANLKSIFRSGGGAIEVAQAGSFFASLRVRNCQFINNKVSHFKGIGENQNGAAIRINNKSTAEVFGCSFKNNQAVTGGAIGATSIERLTIINSSFDSNLSNGYKSTTGYMDVVEGAGALRVDRTTKPLEIYGTSFTRNSANVKVSVMEVFIAPVFGSSPGYPTNEPALVIDNCEFKDNTYNNYAGVSNFQRAFFAGCVVFHGDSAKMKLTNSVFDNNEVGQANVRLINNFEFSNCTFANTKFLNVVDAPQQGAVFLQKIPESGSFNNCTFYKNEPRNGTFANDIMFWQSTVPSRVTLNNSIFYRTNTSANIKQVKAPLMGNGNNQFIPEANMSLFDEVSTTASNKTNPNIIANNIVDMCLGTNSLPANIGGLNDCTGVPSPPPTPTGVVIPGVIQVENYVVKNGDVKTENTPGGGQNLGFIKNNNYTEYDINVAETGAYKLDIFTSSNGVGGNVLVSVGGTNLATLAVPVNNAWHTYNTPVTANLDLVAGVQKIRFTYTGSAGFLFNFDRAEFNINTTTPSTLDCSNAPTGLKVTNTTANSITFSFDNSSTDTRRFELRAFPQGVFAGNINSGAVSYAAAEAGNPSVTIKGLQSGTNYDFVFRALCSGGNPGASSVAPIVMASTSGVSTKHGNEEELGITVYTNPTRGNDLELHGDVENVMYILYNLSGQIVKKGVLTTSIISTQGFPKGIYILELNKGAKRKVLKTLMQ